MVLCTESGQGRINLFNKYNILSYTIQDFLCYQHDYCIIQCSALTSTIVQCKSDQTKCWV